MAAVTRVTLLARLAPAIRLRLRIFRAILKRPDSDRSVTTITSGHFYFSFLDRETGTKVATNDNPCVSTPD
jgi:hypothetical protein